MDQLSVISKTSVVANHLSLPWRVLLCLQPVLILHIPVATTPWQCYVAGLPFTVLSFFWELLRNFFPRLDLFGANDRNGTPQQFYMDGWGQDQKSLRPNADPPLGCMMKYFIISGRENGAHILIMWNTCYRFWLHQLDHRQELKTKLCKTSFWHLRRLSWWNTVSYLENWQQDADPLRW